jgi:Xaa-Pro aminopeptidase
MEYERAKKSWIRDIKIEKMKDFIKKRKTQKIGIDMNNLNAASFMKIKKMFRCVDVSKEIEAARSIKTGHEVKNIKKACSLTKNIFKKINTKNKTETELKNFINFEIGKVGEQAFPTIVSSGKNIKIPHHTPENTKIKKPFLIDMGVRYNGYCSDITRTFGSEYENELEKIIICVEEMLLPGTETKKLDAFVRKQMGKNSKHFITSLGHGLGIEVHEKPWISVNSTDILKPGMVLTIEPGIYVKNGIRIENDYLITKKGFEKLTNF